MILIGKCSQSPSDVYNDYMKECVSYKHGLSYVDCIHGIIDNILLLDIYNDNDTHPDQSDEEKRCTRVFLNHHSADFSFVGADREVTSIDNIQQYMHIPTSSEAQVSPIIGSLGFISDLALIWRPGKIDYVIIQTNFCSST